MKQYFTDVLRDDRWGEKTFEKAEKKIMEHAVFTAIENAGLHSDEVDVLFSGDLLNQIITSSFVARRFNTSYVGLYGACSTMAESLAIGACMVNAGYFRTAACATGSHFSTAERQYRGPLELGNQRPPYAQRTVTGAACTVLSSAERAAAKGADAGVKPAACVTGATFGKVVDYGISDINNMGAAMAPAAMKTLTAHFQNTGTAPDDYDLIATGDLGKLGSDILRDLCGEKGYALGQNYHDCGAMIYQYKDGVCQGGSGCGCGAVILNTYIMDKLADGTFKKVLFAATGALMSPVSAWQGETIPAIAHAVTLEAL
jgi:stage V sporulation protein AD